MIKEQKETVGLATGTRGQLLGRDSSGGAVAEPPENNAPTLADAGIDKEQKETVGLNTGMAGGAKRDTSGTFAEPLDERPTLADAGIHKEQKETVGLNLGAAGSPGPGRGNAVPIENRVSTVPTLADAGIDKKLSRDTFPLLRHDGG